MANVKVIQLLMGYTKADGGYTVANERVIQRLMGVVQL